MHVHAALRFIGHRAQAGDPLAVEVQGVLHARDHRKGAHARLGTALVRGGDF
jgi:hypothetical protein